MTDSKINWELQNLKDIIVSLYINTPSTWKPKKRDDQDRYDIKADLWHIIQSIILDITLRDDVHE